VSEFVREDKTYGVLIQVLREIDDMIALMILVEPVEIDEVAVDQYDIECPDNHKGVV